MRRLVLLILLAACSGPPEDRATTDVPPPATPTADTPPGTQPEPTERAEQTESPGPEPDAPADYRLEEWGLVRVFAEGAELATSGVATGERRLDALETTPHVVVDPGLGVRKPVLYLTPGERWDPTTPITLRVAFPGLHEAWPAPTSRDDAGFAWTARIDGRCDGARAPDASSPHCASLLREHGGVCEAAEIDHYVPDPRPCIQVGETRTPVLLYNGALAGSARALLEMDEDGPRVGEHALAHLWWFDGERLHHAADLAPGARPEPGERVRAPRAQRSGYGTRDLQPDPNELGLLAGEMRRRVGRALEAMGLASAGDFVRAWEPDVLADPLPWRAFAILAPSAVDALLPLTAEPAPRERVRVLALSLEDEPALAQRHHRVVVRAPSRPRVPRVRPGRVQVRGRLPEAVVRQVARRHINEIRFCYEQELNQRPDLEGEVVTRFVVAPTGAVQSAVVHRSTLGNQRVESCVTGAIRRWTLPEPEGGGVAVVEYPFELTAGG